jgi:regulator of sirC expression with transglutaminase-like and TPR domain
MLDAWAREARARVADVKDVSPTAALLAGVCHVLFKEAGLCGNLEAYSDPRNSFLNEVMDRRMGLPITVSIIFVEVARRTGLAAHGVAFPGHFLARVEDPVDPGTFVVVDAFGAGRVLGVEELQALLLRVSQGRTTLAPGMLAPAETPTILKRMLRNLKAAYVEAEDHDRALLAQERLLVLAPDDAAEHLEHANLLDHAMEPAGALTAFGRYLALNPAAPDAAAVRASMKRLRRGLTVQ